MSASDLAIVAAVIFVWGTLSARLERFDVTAPIIFVLAGLLLTHGPLAPLGFAPSHELVKALAEITLVLVVGGIRPAGAGGHRQGSRACGFSNFLHRLAQCGRARPDRQPARPPLRAAYRHHRRRT
jgi:hypothetical protein